MISSKAEMNLQLNVFLVFHKNHTSLSVDYSGITVPNIIALKKQPDMDSAKETNTEAPKIELKDVANTHEAMIQYLCGIRRCYGVPLSYFA